MMTFRYVLLLAGVMSSLVVGQVLPFLVTGFLDSATPNSGNAVNRGGTVTISGFTVKIPDNLLVEFPALMVPFADFASAGDAGRLPPNEVSITGNIVNNVIIAGQMAISQLDLAGSSGIIESLDFDGTIHIKNGPKLRINDPNKKYSAGYTALPFFTADDENPSITAFSGFPMCVPRSAADPKCPQSNRPAGQTSFTVPDALHMVPMKAGDYIEYSGVVLPSDKGTTVCYGIIVNVGVQTDGEQPGFVRVEDALIGVADANIDVEAARYRFVGLASRSDLPVTIWAIDEDPCTGETHDRFLTTTTVEVSARNKWKVDIPRGTDIGLYTRNYRVKIGTTTIETTDGILAGQYIQPVTEWIFPELVTPGGTPPPMDFANIGPLRNGFGPFVDSESTIFGQLTPWPGATAPTPSPATCTVAPPSDPNAPAPALKASAGTDQIVLSGVSVTLTATQDTANVPANELTFSWTQIAGPVMTPAVGGSSPTLIVNTPVIAAGAAAVTREFRVTIKHTSGATATDTVVITSDRAAGRVDHPTFDTLTWASRQSGTAAATAHTDLTAAEGSMKISFNNGADLAMARSATTDGKALYSFPATRNIARVTTATIKSYISGVLVSSVTSTSVGAG